MIQRDVFDPSRVPLIIAQCRACGTLHVMVPVSREHADFLALAIDDGLLEPDAAVDWACEVIIAEADPLADMVELPTPWTGF